MDNCTIFAIEVREHALHNNCAVAKENACCSMDDARKKFEEVYAGNFKKLSFFANSYLNDMQEAENVVQDVFEALWKNFDSIEYDKVVTYIFVAARNMCLNRLKRRNIAQKYNSYKSKSDYLNSIALESSDSLHIFEKDINEIVAKGMNSMKNKVRRTFMLSRIKGLKNREIADVEGVVESTIEARISSALLLMRKMLDDYMK
ncbi:MAG: sigma-70 family RNA polymerase sigma factor [Bacteroidales bacterium]